MAASGGAWPNQSPADDFLGLLRRALPASVGTIVAAEVGKDLIHETATAVAAHMPPEAFQTRAHG